VPSTYEYASINTTERLLQLTRVLNEKFTSASSGQKGTLAVPLAGRNRFYHRISIQRELDGPVIISAFGVRRWKQSTFTKVSHRLGDLNLLYRAPPCFRRHVKLLVSAPFAIVSTHSSFKEG
jgi:hypothetical protein